MYSVSYSTLTLCPQRKNHLHSVEKRLLTQHYKKTKIIHHSDCCNNTRQCLITAAYDNHSAWVRYSSNNAAHMLGDQVLMTQTQLKVIPRTSLSFTWTQVFLLWIEGTGNVRDSQQRAACHWPLELSISNRRYSTNSCGTGQLCCASCTMVTGCHQIWVCHRHLHSSKHCCCHLTHSTPGCSKSLWSYQLICWIFPYEIHTIYFTHVTLSLTSVNWGSGSNFSYSKSKCYLH